MLFTEYIFLFTSRLPPDLKREFDRTALELNRYLDERHRENMKDLMNLPSNWDTFLADLNRGDVNVSDYHRFHRDSLYIFTKKVHKVNYPYELFKTEKRKSKLRKR